jgi:regulator of nonsense transcripts 1
VKCPTTGLYFCNGRGDLPQSHIIHYLRSLHFDQISLPRGNPFADVQIQCYVCRCTDVFKLGFVPNADRSRVFLVCRNPCQFSDVILSQDGVRPESFEPLVSHGAIHADLVPHPPPDGGRRSPSRRRALFARRSGRSCLGCGRRPRAGVGICGRRR